MTISLVSVQILLRAFQNRVPTRCPATGRKQLYHFYITLLLWLFSAYFYLKTTSKTVSHPLQVDIVRQLHVFGVDLQDLQSASGVGDPDVDLPVEPACKETRS